MRKHTSRVIIIKSVLELEPNIDKRTIYNRIYKKGNPFKNDTRITLTIKGKPAIEIARENGIPDRTFYNRCYGLKWTVERSATTPIMRKRKKQ